MFNSLYSTLYSSALTAVQCSTMQYKVDGTFDVLGVVGLMCGSAIVCGVKRLLCKDEGLTGDVGEADQHEDMYMDYNTGTMKTRSVSNL